MITGAPIRDKPGRRRQAVRRGERTGKTLLQGSGRPGIREEKGIWLIAMMF